MKITHVVGTRPNFVKAAPVIHALADIKTLEQIIVHTGQHYSVSLSDNFLTCLNIPQPTINLKVGSGQSSGSHLAHLIDAIENYFIKNRPSIVILYGDVNSTLAGALVASKMNIPIVHVESGLRSFDREMPEEINRMIVDSIADLHFVTEEAGRENLRKEGHTTSIKFVGNTMIDSLIKVASSRSSSPSGVLMTFHRPSNVDNKRGLIKILDICEAINEEINFPMHPRTRNKIKQLGLYDGFMNIENLTIYDPVDYIEFIKMMEKSLVVITDSGGIQEETTFLGVPCLTVRKNTERPSTINMGTNILVDSCDEIVKIIEEIKNGKYKKCNIPPMWDGKAAIRIKDEILDFIQ